MGAEIAPTLNVERESFVQRIRSSVVYVAIPWIALICGFITLIAVDEQTTLGSSEVLHINKAESSADEENFISALEEQARARHLNIARQTFDAKGDIGATHMTMIVGDPSQPSARWVEDGYSGFSRNQRVSVEPWDDAEDLDPRGIYLIYGEAENADGLLQELERAGGYGGLQYPLYSASNISRSLGGTPLAGVFFCMAAGCVCTVFVLGMRSSRRYARKRLFGGGYLSLAGQEVGAGLKAQAISLLVAVPLVGAFLWIYNSGAFLGLYASVTALLLVVLDLLTIITHLIVVALTMKLPITEALKGRLPARATFLSLHVIRAVVLILLISTIFSIGRLQVESKGYSEAQRFWEQPVNSSVNYIDTAGANRSEEEENSISEWIRGEVQEGNILISQSDSILPSTPTGSAEILGTTLTVNRQYIEANVQKLPAAVSEEIRGHADGREVLAFIPEGSEFSEDVLRGQLPYELPDKDDLLITEYQYPAGATFFDYGKSNVPGMSLIEDPALIYLPDDLVADSAPTIAAWSTQGGALALDRTAALERLKGIPAREQIAGIKNAAAQQASFARENQQDLNLSRFSAALLALMFLILTGAAAKTYMNEHGQEGFRRFLHGWGFLRSNRVYLLVEGAVLLALAGWALSRLPSLEYTMAHISVSSGQVQNTVNFTLLLSITALLAAAASSLWLAHWNHRREIGDRIRND